MITELKVMSNDWASLTIGVNEDSIDEFYISQLEEYKVDFSRDDIPDIIKALSIIYNETHICDDCKNEREGNLDD